MNLCALPVIPLLIVLWMGCAHAGDRILSYQSDVVIHEDTTMTVTETISVKVGGYDIKHGIFRDFPTDYKSKNGIVRKRGFEVVEVSLDGGSVNYVVENLRFGKRVRIGSASKYLTAGVYDYRIKYRTTRQLGYFENHDELYWNVTGNGWKFPIDHVTATVTLPPGAKVIKTDAWSGETGSTNIAVTTELLGDGRVRFTSREKLGPRHGLTFKVLFPKGHVDYANDQDGWWSLTKDNPVAGFMVFVFFLLLAVLLTGWFREGIDPRPGTIIPRYKAPDGFSAAAVRFMRNTGFDDTVFTAAILSLAAKGALLIRDSKGTVVLKKRDTKRSLTSEEKDLHGRLFSKKKKLVLDPANASSLITAKSKLEMDLRAMLEPKYYRMNSRYIYVAMAIFCGALAGLGMFVDSVPIAAVGMHIVSLACVLAFGGALRKKWNGNHRSWLSLLFTMGALAFWGLSLFVIWQEISSVVAVACIACELLTLIFCFLIKAYTKAGRNTLDEIEGLRLYLKVAEKDRLELENPPERTPEHFEEFLPFALALGVEQQWAEQFHGVLSEVEPAGSDSRESAYTPSFYQGGSKGLGVAGLAAATAAIASTLGANLSAAAVSPSSSGGGSSGGGYSGGGGGGFSGGGGGGGGGGGW